MPDPREDPFAEHREWQRLSKLELVIRFADAGDFDFKAAGEGSTAHELTAHNVANASRLEIKGGALIIEVPSPDELRNTGRTAEWTNRARSALYLEVAARYSPPENVWGDAYSQLRCLLSVKDDCDEALIVFADALGTPGDGNSQVFTASWWNRSEAAAAEVTIKSLYAAQRQVGVAQSSELFGAEGGSNPPFTSVSASMVGTKFSVDVARTGKPNLVLHGTADELACWKDYGVERSHYLRICLGAKRSANSQRARLALSTIEIAGLWNPPWLQGH